MGLQFCFCYPCNQREVQLSGWKWDQEEISCSPRVSLAWVISGVALSTLTAGLDSLSHTFCVSMNYTNFEDLLRTSRRPLNSMPVGNMWDQNRNTMVHLVFLSRKKKKQNLGKKSFEIGLNCIWTYKWFRKHARQDYGHQLKVLSYVSFCDLISVISIGNDSFMPCVWNLAPLANCMYLKCYCGFTHWTPILLNIAFLVSLLLFTVFPQEAII